LLLIGQYKYSSHGRVSSRGLRDVPFAKCVEAAKLCGRCLPRAVWFGDLGAWLKYLFIGVKVGSLSIPYIFDSIFRMLWFQWIV